MAQRFSKAFYNSKQWADIREYILKRDNYLCVQCGHPAEEVHHKVWLTPKNIGDPNVTSNEDNLISLCKDCHFEIHRDQKIQAVINANKKNVIGDEYEFNSDGYLVRKDDSPPIF